MAELEPIEKHQNVSYLFARDPSIFAGNFNLNPCRITYTTKCEIDSEESNENLQVYLRIKKARNFEHLYEITEDNHVLLCKPPKESYAMRNNRDQNLIKKYTFTKIFGPETIQCGLFNEVVKGKVLNFINGKNCTILTYGASGSGKTFTIVGTDSEPGIVPRTLEYLFRTLPKLSELPTIKPEPNGRICKNINSKKEVEMRQKILNAFCNTEERSHHIRTYNTMKKRLSEEPAAILSDVSNDVSLSVWVSFAEIYNECIYDLLQEEPPRGKKRTQLRLGKGKDYNYIKDLTYVHVHSGIQAYEILQYGLHNLNYASTNVNSHSSRSHSIFSIKLAQASNTENGYNVSCFNFCDLAGSERVKKTQNIGDRLKESNNINTSLMVLGRCIKCVRDSQKNNEIKMIPFRESKLTQLFQNALLGQEDIRLIVNINPALDMFDESQHVLNFSAIAKDIIIEPQKMIVRKGSRLSQYLQSRGEEFEVIEETENELEILREEVYRLTQELELEKRESEQNEFEARQEVKNFYKKQLEEERKLHEIQIEKLKAQYENQLKKKSDVICIDSSSDDDDDNDDDGTKKSALLRKNFDNEIEIKKLMQQISTLKNENMNYEKLTEEAVKELKKVQMINCEYEIKISYLESKLAENENTILQNHLRIQKYEKLLSDHDIKIDETDESDHESKDENVIITKNEEKRESLKKNNLEETVCGIHTSFVDFEKSIDTEKENLYCKENKTKISERLSTVISEKYYLTNAVIDENSKSKEPLHDVVNRFTTILKPHNT